MLLPTGAPSNPVPLPSTTTIALSLQTAPPSGDFYSHDPLIDVSIGGSAPIQVMFDTGSVGLRVTSAALATSTSATNPIITYSPTHTSIEYDFGDTGPVCVWSGYSAVADIKIGTIDLGDQYFDIITSKTTNCGPTLMNLNGILGVRPILTSQGDDQHIHNLMTALPSPLNTGFIVSLYQKPPIVTVGLTPGNSAGFQTYQATAVASPYPYWSPSAFPWHYSIIPPEMARIDVLYTQVITDSGGQDAQFYINGAPPSPQPAALVTAFPTATLLPLPPSTAVTATLGGITWTLPPTGRCDGYNVVNAYFVASGAEQPAGTQSTNGINPFFTNDIMYDFVQNRFGFHAVPAPAPTPAFC